MARYAIVHEETERQMIAVAVFENDNEEICLKKLMELNGDGPAKYAMVDTWRNRAIVA